MSTISATGLASIMALGVLQAQPAQPPVAYSATVVNSMGPSVTMKVYRDGSKGMVEQSTAPSQPGAKPSYVRSYFDFDTHKTFSTDLNYATPNCNAGTFNGDWGDPFELTKGVMADVNQQNPKQTGTETVNGFPTKVVEAGTGADKTKVWLDMKYGLLIKAVSGGKTIIEVQRFAAGKPAAALLTVPAACLAPASSPDADRIAKLTGDDPANFLSSAGNPGSAEPCSILFRAVHGGSMEPISYGFQLAIDAKPDSVQNPSYSNRLDPTGRVLFSGGGLHEITGQLRKGAVRLEDVPRQFYIAAHFFNNAGEASTQINRNCISPLTVLLMVVHNPARLGEGVDWLWVKSGKFASGN